MGIVGHCSWPSLLIATHLLHSRCCAGQICLVCMHAVMHHVWCMCLQYVASSVGASQMVLPADGNPPHYTVDSVEDKAAIPASVMSSGTVASQTPANLQASQQVIEQINHWYV